MRILSHIAKSASGAPASADALASRNRGEQRRERREPECTQRNDRREPYQPNVKVEVEEKHRHNYGGDFGDHHEEKRGYQLRAVERRAVDRTNQQSADATVVAFAQQRARRTEHPGEDERDPERTGGSLGVAHAARGVQREYEHDQD